MNILFIHRTFPGQFEFIIQYLLQEGHKVTFITNNERTSEMQGVKKYIYKLKRQVSPNCSHFLQHYEQSVIHAEAVAELALELKNNGYKPDIIYGFSGWGSSMFIKDVFQDVPFLCYFGWFEQPENSVFDFDGTVLDTETREKIQCNNTHLLMNLYSCDAGITETNWQRSQIPKEFQSKIKVIHNGVSTELCKPDVNAKFFIKDKNLELNTKNDVITYGTRGMEPYRGFPQFMEAVEKLLNKRPNAHFVIAGEDIVCYSPKLCNGKTYKEQMLEKLDIDMNRVHFVGGLPFDEYVNLLQISSAHVYLTYPYVLSWSLLDAMATGCCVVASNSQPVLEVIEDNYNGLLVDFFDVDMLVKKIEYALDNKDKMIDIRNNARQTMLEKYDFNILLPKQAEYIKTLLKK